MVAEFFAELARRALAISGLAVLLSVVLPKGGMRDCARLVLGVMLVASLLQPILDVFSRDVGGHISAEIFTDWGATGRDDTAEIIAAGGRIAEGAEAQAREQLAADLERQIAALVCRDGAVKDCEVDVEVADEVAAVSAGGNNWGQVFIVLDMQGASVDVVDKIAADVAAFYDLSTSAVRVSVMEY